MKTIRSIFFLAVLALLTTAMSFIFVTSTVTAEAEWQKKCSSLQPEFAEVTAPEFEVILRDNDVIVRGTSYVVPEATFQGFEWAIDLKIVLTRPSA